MQVQGLMPVSTFRHIIDVNKPFDEGYMFLNGNRYSINDDYAKTTYDTTAVTYITYQEEGTKFFDGNAGFISQNTITELNQVAVYEAHGITQERVAFRDATRARQSMVSQGAIQQIKTYNQAGRSGENVVG